MNTQTDNYLVVLLLCVVQMLDAPYLDVDFVFGKFECAFVALVIFARRSKSGSCFSSLWNSLEIRFVSSDKRGVSKFVKESLMAADM